jgi:membrane associated rhomboid family serine protease
VVPAAWHLDRFADLARLPRLSLTLVTSQLLHGSPMHLGANMLYLWIFGDNVEDRLGHGRFLALYLTSGVLAAVIQLLMQPHSAVPMIGASGAIAGVLGAYLLFFPSAKIVALVPWFVLEFVELPAFIFLGLWFLLQWMQGMTTIGQVADLGGVAWWAHVGGFVSGFGLGLILRPRRQYF